MSPAPRPWQLAYVVLGLLLMPVAGLTFVDWVGGNTDAPLNAAWVFGLTAVAAFAAALRGGVRYGCLLGGLALIVAWLALWSEVLDDGLDNDIGTFRGLMLLIALILLVLGGAIAVRGRPQGGGSDLVTVAGFSAVFAAGLLTVGPTGSQLIVPAGVGVGPLADTNLFWDLVLLLSSLALIAYGAVSGFRGPAYVGAFGLTLFIYIVGADLDDSSPAGKVLGWPLILLVVAAALVVWSLLPALRRRATDGPAPPQAPQSQPPAAIG